MGYNNCFIVSAIDPQGDEDEDGILNADEDANGDGVLSNDDVDGDGIEDFWDPELGVDEVNSKLFRIYPNPATDVISIAGVDENTQVSIFDLNGRKLQQRQNTQQIDVSNLQSGIYLVEISSTAKRQTLRFIKQ